MSSDLLRGRCAPPGDPLTAESKPTTACQPSGPRPRMPRRGTFARLRTAALAVLLGALAGCGIKGCGHQGEPPASHVPDGILVTQFTAGSKLVRFDGMQGGGWSA